MTTLTIKCMYCDEDMGTKDGEGVEGETTSICRECWAKHFPQWPYPDDEDAEIASNMKDYWRHQQSHAEQ